MKARLYIKQVYTVDHEVVIETDMAEHDLDVLSQMKLNMVLVWG